MSEKKLAYDFWNTPDGIRSQKIFDMRDRIRRLEASNKELRELVCDIDEELSLAQADAIETGNMTGSSLPANLIIRLRREINKAKGVQDE